jgi:hypothetical protein
MPAASAATARLASKTGLAAATTALVGAFYSSLNSSSDDTISKKSGHLVNCYALLPPPRSSFHTAKCEAPKRSEAGNVIRDQEEKPKSSDPTDYAGGAAQFGASASDAEGLVRAVM